jgi:hypothetical protein
MTSQPNCSGQLEDSMTMPKRLPELSDIRVWSDDSFGLTTLDHALTFGHMIKIKEEVIKLEDFQNDITRSLEFEQNVVADHALETI